MSGDFLRGKNEKILDVRMLSKSMPENPEHQEIKSQAKRQGYLRYDEPLQNSYAVESWWEERCFSIGSPAILAVRRCNEASLSVSFTLPPGCRFSPYAYEELAAILRRHSDCFTTDARSVGISVQPQSLDELIADVSAVYHKDQTEERKRQAAEYFSSPIEGRARCLCSDGMGDDIATGDIVYIREIPNMLGHCIVLKNGVYPLVGVHLDRFEILYPYE